MKLIEMLPLRESPFTPRHFPQAINKGISGAGERTPYTELPVNQPGGGGFRVMKQTKVVRGKHNVAEVTPGTQIFWTLPAKLYSAAALGEKGVSNHAVFGFKSAAQKDAVGFIPISAVQKPSDPDKLPRRVVAGKVGQDEVYQYLVNAYGTKFQTIEQLALAGIGSTKADLIVSFDGARAQFEIKNASAASAPLTLFDKVVRRDKPNKIIDELVSVMTGYPRMTLARAVDRVRQKDRSFGFPGDRGVSKSGNFVLRITDADDLMMPAHDYIVDHFASSGDNYLAINHTGGKVSIYYTGHGENILAAPELPLPQYIDLRTAGGRSAGGMRLGVKIKL